ncbi:MAG: hypothetical protein ACYTF9_11595 [Planctomycetota bacterium]
MLRSEIRRCAGLGTVLVAMLLCPEATAQQADGEAHLVQHDRRGLTFDRYRPDRYIGNHRRHSQSRLRYHSKLYPFDRGEYHRRTYPHTYRGSLGLPPREDKLTLRFFGGPGFSPYSRYQHPEQEMYLDRYWEETENPTLPPLPPGQAIGMDDEPAPRPRANPPLVRRPRPNVMPRVRVSHDWGLEAPVPSAQEIEDSDYQRAWDKLASGDAESAQYAFAALALARPGRGLPKAGYALSMACQDDLHHAAWSMRRAFKVDADSIRNVPVDETLEIQLEKLLEAYGPEGSTRVRPNDARFMTAAIHFMLKHETQAYDALREAIHGGDIDASTLMLLELMGRERRKGKPGLDEDLRADIRNAGA